MNNLTLITCSYNTPEITLTMLRSFVHIHKRAQRIILIDNSTNDETSLILTENHIPFTRIIGGTHGNGVNKALELCETKYALLVDTDVIFLKDHSDIFEQFKTMGLALMGKIEGDRGGKRIYKRVNPWHCFIDVEQIKQNNIRFFNETKMRTSFNTNIIYDVGSTFFEDVKHAKLKIGDIDLCDEYYLHLEGMSWYNNKFDPLKKDTGIDFGGTHNNQTFVKLYEQKYNYFQQFNKKYINTCIQNMFMSTSPRLLIKFPTRGRKQKFFNTLNKYYEFLSGKHNVQFLITCDIDDTVMNNESVITKLNNYNNLYFIFGNSKTKVEAINADVSNQTFDIILLASDDMIPAVKGYDEIIINTMCDFYPKFDGVLWFNDGTQENRLNTLCILGRQYYDKFGYIYNPAYKSLWCDVEFTQVGTMLKKQTYFDQCIIRHEHHSVIGQDLDELYITNEKFENEDKITYLNRQRNNFEYTNG